MRGWGRATLGADRQGGRQVKDSWPSACGGRAMAAPAGGWPQPARTKATQTDRTGTGDPRSDETRDAGGRVGLACAPGPLAVSDPGCAATMDLPRNCLWQGHLQELVYSKGIPVDNLLFALV